MENIITMYQMQTGLESDPLEDPEPQAYTDGCWMKEFIISMKKYRVSIHRKDRVRLLPNLMNDTNVMREFKNKGYNATDLRRMNTCRQHLKVIYLSDITNARGNDIDLGYYFVAQHDSNLNWPNVPHLPGKTWNTWRKAVQTTFGKTLTTNKLKSESLLVVNGVTILSLVFVY